MNKRIGRPPLPDAMHANLVIRVGARLDRALRAKAEALGMPRTVYARMVLEMDLLPLDLEGLNEVAKSGGH